MATATERVAGLALCCKRTYLPNHLRVECPKPQSSCRGPKQTEPLGQLNINLTSEQWNGKT